MHIKDIVEKYSSKLGITDSLVIENCFEFIVLNMYKCDLDKDVKSYISILAKSYFIRKMRTDKINKINSLVV